MTCSSLIGWIAWAQGKEEESVMLDWVGLWAQRISLLFFSFLGGERIRFRLLVTRVRKLSVMQLELVL